MVPTPVHKGTPEGSVHPEHPPRTDGAKELTVAVIDDDPGVPSGHLVPAMRHVVLACNELGLETLVFASEEVRDALARDSTSPWQEESVRACPHEAVPRGTRAILQRLLSVADESLEHRIVAFWPWWQQLDLECVAEMDAELQRHGISVATIGNVSSVVRQTEPDPTELGFLRKCAQLDSVTTVFYWDAVESSSLPPFIRAKAKRLPEFHDSESSGSFTAPETRTRSLALFGGLTGHRGVGELIWLSLLNRRLTFQAVGASLNTRGIVSVERHRPFTYKFLAKASDRVVARLARMLLKSRPNLEVRHQYFENQIALNDALRTQGALLAVGHRHPYSSGIALQALACGVPVLWTPGNSAIADHLERCYPAGRLSRRHFTVPNALDKDWGDLVDPTVASAAFTWADYRQSLHDGLFPHCV